MPAKLGLTTAQRKAVLRNQASNLLWYGKITTTKARAKAVQSYVEKIITDAVNTYEDTLEVTKTRIVKVEKKTKGKKKDAPEMEKKEVEVVVVNDGPKKLAARRRIIGKLYDFQEIRGAEESEADYKARVKGIKHPLIEKLFNEIAPKYAERKESLGQGGGYTRIYILKERAGDGAEMAVLELV